MTDHRYPRDYTDRQLLEAIWRRIDGLAAMMAGPTPPTERIKNDD